MNKMGAKETKRQGKQKKRGRGEREE